METKGHLATSGGLRGHSVTRPEESGETVLYPWSVVGIGYDGWQATNLETGQVSGPVTSYEAADDYAYMAKHLGLLFRGHSTAYELMAEVAEDSLAG